MDAPAKWLGRHALLDAAHADDLEAAAAVHELQHGLPREAAEDKAHADYVVRHALQAAAHHLQGIRAAYASGNMDVAQQHGRMYMAALRCANLGGPMGPVPKEVLDLVGDAQVYNYRAHPADQFFAGDEEDGGADDADARLKEALERIMALRASLK